MKKVIKIVVIILLAAFAVLQFFQIDKSGLPIVQAETIEASVAVPPDVALILGRSCNDCHTNATIYPWYSYIQPAGWFLDDHIDAGRRHLNFSVFNTYEPKKKAHKLEEICEMVESKEMPLPSYLWIHWDAVLKDTEAKALCDWANEERAKILQSGIIAD
ncbi:MAG: heme-binding domain-containing protein [Pyrinomonadaceae bacterium]